MKSCKLLVLLLAALVLCESFASAEPEESGQKPAASKKSSSKKLKKSSKPQVRRTVRVKETEPLATESAPVQQLDLSNVGPTNQIDVNPNISVGQPAAGEKEKEKEREKEEFEPEEDEQGQSLASKSGNRHAELAVESGNSRQKVLSNSNNTETIHIDGVGNHKEVRISNVGNRELSERHERAPSPLAHPTLPLQVAQPQAQQQQQPIVQINLGGGAPMVVPAQQQPQPQVVLAGNQAALLSGAAGALRMAQQPAGVFTQLLGPALGQQPPPPPQLAVAAAPAVAPLLPVAFAQPAPSWLYGPQAAPNDHLYDRWRSLDDFRRMERAHKRELRLLRNELKRLRALAEVGRARERPEWHRQARTTSAPATVVHVHEIRHTQANQTTITTPAPTTKRPAPEEAPREEIEWETIRVPKRKKPLAELE